MGGRSRAAAQVLSGQGFREVYNLAGGIKAWKGETVSGPPDFGRAGASGAVTAAHRLEVARVLEEERRRLHEALADELEDSGLSELFRGFAAAGASETDELLALYRKLGGEPASGAAVREPGPARPSSREAARALEAEAMDLFLLYARESETEEERDLFLKLADRARAQLGALAGG